MAEPKLPGEKQLRKSAVERLSAPIEIDFVIRDGKVAWLRDGMSSAQKLQSMESTVLSQGMRAAWDLDFARSPATDPIFTIKDWRIAWGPNVDYEVKYGALEVALVGGPGSMDGNIGPDSYPAGK